MNWLTDEAKTHIRKFACEHPDEETCGFVLTDSSVVLTPNMASDRANEFEICPHDFATYEERVLGVWHSHLTLAGFSPLDQQVMASDTIPWAVYCLADDSWHECNPTEVAPFEGRPFVFGVYDCYSLVRDYLDKKGVALPQWERKQWGEWNTVGFTPFDDEWSKIGRSIKPGDQKEGDILLLNLGDVPMHTDHVGVFTDCKHFLHHPSEGKSRVQTFGSYWLRRLNWIVRPFELCKS